MLKGTNEEISAGTGGRVAGPIAKAMLDAVFAADAAAAAAADDRPADPTTEPSSGADAEPPTRRRPTDGADG